MPGILAVDDLLLHSLVVFFRSET